MTNTDLWFDEALASARRGEPAGFDGLYNALGGPLLVVVVPNWRGALLVSAALVIVAAVVAFQARDTWPEVAPNLKSKGSRPPLAPTALSLGALCAFVAIEVTTGQWAFTHLTEERQLGDTLAAVAVSLFWGGLTVGRLAMVRPEIRNLTSRIGLSRLVIASLVFGASISFVPAALAVPMLALSGVTLAPIVPTLFASTASRVGEGHAQQVAVYQLVATNIGAIGVPFLTGQLVDAIDPSVIVMVTTTTAAIGALLLVAIERLPQYLTDT